ncbi:hypothetical protein PENARI_c018G10647 [Penicillium arizonense]|uniref:Uncharacterized protein n=1 Tax=Penicillium arizonense TaxID=1835702 RepID=A0A1F5L9U3_PENAI|nr:hypothetical protein PENARI_c018G10647 [Penicillium arizonense]OGE50008.1 hypothetical protein PENARI_c018G10647 [Penicillium arizonense]
MQLPVDFVGRLTCIVQGALIATGSGYMQRQFTDRNLKLLDTSQKQFYVMSCIQQWLQVVLDLLVADLATVLVALAVFVTKQTSSGAVGVALVNLLFIQLNVDIAGYQLDTA